MVSQIHAELVAKSRPDLKFAKLEQPVPVSVAGPCSSLRAVGTMQVPIVWENGRVTTFTMLVVPNLSWPILFGQNHLRMTDANIRSKALTVFFADPSMNFDIVCYDCSPLTAFPTLDTGTLRHSSVANVTCLLTPLPPPSSGSSSQTHLSLSRGLNLVTVCLILAGSLIGSPLFSGPLWLEGRQFSPGLQTLSGPINLHSIQQTSPSGNIQHSFFPATQPSHPKCRPSRPLPPVDNLGPAFLAPEVGSPSCEDSSLQRIYTTNVLIHSVNGSAELPFNAALGSIRVQTEPDIFAFQDAANYTAQQLADSWHSQFSAPRASIVSLPTNVTESQTSDILSPFVDLDLECEHSFPPTQDTNLDMSSPDYLPLLFQTLELDTPAYAHVPGNIMRDFKHVIAKYPEAFYLPNAPLSTVHGFQHNIHTGDAPPVYRLPYRKSPAELLARHGRLRGLNKAFPYLQMDGGTHCCKE